MNSKLRYLFFLILIFILGFSTPSKADIHIKNLRCESLNNPLGIDAENPRLSWQIESDDRGVMQTAYRILVSSSEEKLSNNEGDHWDSGKTTSDRSIHISYNGKDLDSKMDCFWKVKVWTSKGESQWSEPANWSMGLLYYNEWWGRWIGFDRPFEWDTDSFHSRLSARYFRKEFESTKKIKKARAYIMGLGLYELYLNGKKIGDQVLAPTPTDYTKNVRYNVLDVTDAIQNGENAVGVILGNGRYYTMRRNYKPYKIKNFGYPKLMLHLEINYEDGTKQVVYTNDSWKGSADGPIRVNNEYDGEEYDARKEIPGWSSPGFDDSDWLPAEYVEYPRGNYEAQMNPNMKVVKSIQPVSINKMENGKYILDLGQNMVGWLKMKVEGNSGDQVQLRFAEILNEDDEIFTANLRDAKATDLYILKGEGMETWEPKFVYHGFRYVEITGYPGEPKLENFTGQVVSDEMETTGKFETSITLVNQIYKNSWWGILGNYKGMPIDCPQRNERQPWLGDRTVVCYGESFLFDNAALYGKWTDDIGYAQKADGALPDVAPAYWRYYSDNVTWPGTFLMVADMLHQQYGDVQPIKKHYASMKKWMDYMRERYMMENYIITEDSYGDWCAPPATIEEGRGKSANVKHKRKFISTAYYCHLLELMQKFAALTGNEEDIPVFAELSENMNIGFNREFYHPESGTYGEDKLTDYLLAVSFDLVPENRKEETLDRIEYIIEERNNGHLSTGVVGTQWLMRALTENGRADLAWKLATNTTYPSWGYMVENGATTIWELWNGNTAAPNMNSYNHVMMLGDLNVWFFENLAGIKSDRDETGFKKIIMKPEIVEGLDFVNASYKSVHGEIKSHWKKNIKKFEWELSIPSNTSALVHIPASSPEMIREGANKASEAEGVKFIGMEMGKAVYEVGSGNYSFRIND